MRRAGEDVRRRRRAARARRDAWARPRSGRSPRWGAARSTALAGRRVAMLVTGDELVEPGRPLGPGQIRNSNAYAVPPLALDAGAEMVDVGDGGRRPRRHAGGARSARSPRPTSSSSAAASRSASTTTSARRSSRSESSRSSGASRCGPASRPTSGSPPGGTLVFGLPGNPVSAMVTFLLFARPALLAMQGADPDANRVARPLRPRLREGRGAGGGDPGPPAGRRRGLGRDADRSAGLARPDLDAGGRRARLRRRPGRAWSGRARRSRSSCCAPVASNA